VHERIEVSARQEYLELKAKHESKHKHEQWDEQTLQVSILVIKKGPRTRSDVRHDIALLAFWFLTVLAKGTTRAKKNVSWTKQGLNLRLRFC
jgi:hypothetical protein